MDQCEYVEALAPCDLSPDHELKREKTPLPATVGSSGSEAPTVLSSGCAATRVLTYQPTHRSVLEAPGP
eukprot:2552944-Lingulodinium_polyedra.AAC.1